MSPSTVDSQDQRYAVGLDVGGTKIAGGLVAFPAIEVFTRQTIPTRPGRGGRAVLLDALGLAEGLLAEAASRELDVTGIGVGVPELVDLHGRVTSGHTIRWQDVPVQKAFSRLALAVIESDVRAAARAEALFGAGAGLGLFVYVTVGTGISSCLVQDGVPFAGARGNALVLASSPLSADCTARGAVSASTLEQTASGPALVARYNESSERPVAQAEEVIAAAEGNDPLAIEVVSTAGHTLGASVGFLVNVLDPEALVVGGGLGLSGGLYWDSFETAARQHIWADSTRDLPILQASLGTDAGFIGAAALAAGR